jgi:hypothetical protein
LARPHKHAGAHIELTSELPPDRLAELCKQAGQQFNRIECRLEEVMPGRLVFTIRGGLSKRMQSMTFQVLNEIRDGRSHLPSRISHYKTKQDTFMFIPVGPKQMLGLKAYRTYMHNLEALVKDADPTASVSVIEGKV